MAMRQARRIAQDIAEANTLPNIRVSCMHERMDLLLAHIGLEDPRGGTLVRMPLMIQLERDYPLSAPNVGFPVHFDYDMGATDHIQEGDLAGCMVLCLNITGNFNTPYYGLQPKKASVHSGTGTRWRAKSRRSPRRRWEPTAAAGGAFGGAGGRARRLRPCPDHPGPSVARFSRARGPRAPRGLAWPRSAAGARCSRSASARRAGASGEGGCAGYAGPRDTRPTSSAKRGAPPASRARPAPLPSRARSRTLCMRRNR